jgi:hypothetical protein
MFTFPSFEGIVARCDGRGVQYHPDRRAVTLDNFHCIGASLPRRPNGSGDVRLRN